MATIVLSALLTRARGKIGGLVINKRGSTFYLSSRPDFSKRRLSKAQRQQIVRFKGATAFAKAQLANPTTRRLHEKRAKTKRRSAYHLLISEYMKRDKG